MLGEFQTTANYRIGPRTRLCFPNLRLSLLFLTVRAGESPTRPCSSSAGFQIPEREMPGEDCHPLHRGRLAGDRTGYPVYRSEFVDTLLTRKIHLRASGSPVLYKLLIYLMLYGAPREIRTPDLLIRSQWMRIYSHLP